MAKIKIVKFEIVSLLSESKKIIEYLQKTGATQFDNVENEELIKYKTSGITEQFDNRNKLTIEACEILRKNISAIKAPSIFGDKKCIEYSDYKLLGDRSDELSGVVRRLIKLQKEIDSLNKRISLIEADIEAIRPWESLDVEMSSHLTSSVNIFLGTFPQTYTEEEIISLIKKHLPDVDDVAVQVVSSQKLLTCAFIMCHKSGAIALEAIFKNIGFAPLKHTSSKLPKALVEEYEEKIHSLKGETVFLQSEIKSLEGYYGDLLLYSDYLLSQREKYIAVENAASSKMAFYIKGFVVERESEEIKFNIENSFTAQMEIQRPDIGDESVPVLIENSGFAAGVESITNMYSPPSNRDVDPNPIMAIFYYLFFGLMLSDGGYGLLMVIFSFIVRKKVKADKGAKAISDMAFYCGVSATFWGLLFGSWFGDLVPVICTEFLGYSSPPQLALWLNPTENSITVLLMSFLLGIGHLFAGLGIKFFMLIKEKNYSSAIFDIIPVMIFVVGFAIFGGGFFTELDESVKSGGRMLLASGAVLIVLTAGRSAKNIFGKLALGLYGLYNTASGYLGDILSYSRLLALGLVTGVIASVINALGAMTGNPIVFVIIFLIGHTFNLAINLVGTYVHCCRLQYVEFFSKFYEGGGKAFTPFKIKSKFFTLKEDNKYG